MEKKNILVIFGGCSPEYNVSLQSAQGVISHIDRDKYTVTMLGISSAGKWYFFGGTPNEIGEDRWLDSPSCAPAAILPDRGMGCLTVFRGEGTERIKIDAAFPVLHGRNGEDGTVQGLLELAGIPTVGCGVLASALCMDKERAHKLAALAGVRVPTGFTVERGYNKQEAAAMAESIGYPLFVKPVRAGSSFGITKVTDRRLLTAALDVALSYDGSAIIEQNIDGFEVGCAVMGGKELITGEIDEIELSGGFFDYSEKYGLINSRIHVPARISPEKARELKETAKKIYRALGCCGFARVDMFLTPDGEICFNEVNTIPGFTPHSRFPKMMMAAGYSFEKVLDLAIEGAIE